MKKLLKTLTIMMIAGILSGMAVQAESTISWDFNSLGDTEEWGTTPSAGLTNGVIVTNAVLGSEVVLTTPDITGVDPGMQIETTNSVPVGEYWDTIEIRWRTLDGNGGLPTTYEEAATIMVINEEVVNSGTGWTNTFEANEWVITSYDISSLLGSNDVTYLRLDPPAANDTQNFEVDYVRLHATTNPPPALVFKYAWEFNTPGDPEEWVGSAHVDTLSVGNAVSGSESVLTALDIIGGDPQLNLIGGVPLAPGLYWSAIEIRIRLLDGNAGTPIAWNPVGTLLFPNNVVKSTSIGGSGWVTTTEAGEWIVTRFDMSYLETANIFGLRIDPLNGAALNFEIDYVRLETRTTPPLPPAPSQLVKDWEFNTGGDTEDITALNVSGLTVSSAINGTESVLTSAEVTGNDPQLLYNVGKSGALTLSPAGPWETMEIRIRQLDKDPGDAGVASQPWSIIGTLVFINPGSANASNLGAINSTTNEADNWIISTVDISYLGMNDLINFRMDPVGNDDPKNFEIDYIRVYSQGGSYDAWSQSLYGLAGTNAMELADADLDTYNNLYEYAFGGNPTNAAEHGLVESKSVDIGGTNYFEYTYARRTGFNTGLGYALEQRGDLTLDPWVTNTTAEVGTLQVTDDYEVVTNRIETIDATEFLRVTVENQ